MESEWKVLVESKAISQIDHKELEKQYKREKWANYRFRVIQVLFLVGIAFVFALIQSRD